MSKLVGLGNPQVRRFTLLANVPISTRTTCSSTRRNSTGPRRATRRGRFSAPGWKPCRAGVLGGDRKTAGDPLTSWSSASGRPSFPRRSARAAGRDPTITVESSLHIAGPPSSAAGTLRPVSPLYVLRRRQDVAFQKARGSAADRTHMRLWMLR